MAPPGTQHPALGALLAGERGDRGSSRAVAERSQGMRKRLGGGYWRLEMQLGLALGYGDAFGVESGPECWGGRGVPPLSSDSLRHRRGGQFRGEIFVCQFGAEIFPTTFFLRNSGSFLLLAHPLWWRSPGIVALLTPVRLFVISIHLVRLGVTSWSSSRTSVSFVRGQNRPHLLTVGGVEVPRV